MRGARAPIQWPCDQAPFWRPRPPVSRGAEHRPNDLHRQGGRPGKPTKQAVSGSLAGRILDGCQRLACKERRRRPQRGGSERIACELSDENANTQAHQRCVCWLHVERSSSLGHACIVPRHGGRRQQANQHGTEAPPGVDLAISAEPSAEKKHHLELEALQTGQASKRPVIRAAQKIRQKRSVVQKFQTCEFPRRTVLQKIRHWQMEHFTACSQAGAPRTARVARK